MSWQGRIPGSHRNRIILAHQQAWLEIEARAPIDALNYQAENDRLGYILAELWQAQVPDGELVALAIARFDAAEPSKTEPDRAG